MKIERFEVPTFTLSQLFETGRVERCDLLKVDIEGAEYELFENIPDQVWSKIFRIVMEVHRDGRRSEKDLIQVLEKKGFRAQVRNESTDTSLLWAVRSDLS